MEEPYVPGMQDANARLFAELLAMLKEMTYIAQRVDGWQSFPMEPIQKACALIRKVEGND